MTSNRRRAADREIALAAYRLHKKGYTNSEIALQTGIRRKVVSNRIKLGERLMTMEQSDDAG